MSDGERAHDVPRARPLSDPAVEALLERTRELARRWAVAMVLERQLEDLGQLPLEIIAREAPALCGQLLRSLRSESELALLIGDDDGSTRGGAGLARRVGTLAGAHDSAALIAAVEALRGVIWEALLAELDHGGPGASHSRRLADALDRLAHVCSALLPAALSAAESGRSERAADSGTPPLEPSTATEKAPDFAASGTRERIVIVDERRHEPRVESRAPERAVIASPELSDVNEIEVRDERGDEGPAAWIGSIGRCLERFEQDRLSFAVLLVELSSGCAEDGLAETLEDALQGTLRDSGGGSLTRERDGRYWLLVPRTDRSRAGDVAERVSIAVAAAGAAKGVEVAVAVGSAVCPQDGRQASSLAAHADIGLYAARSRARSGGLAAAPAEER